MILAIKPRVQFDVNNKEHLKIVTEYLQTNTWKEGCPFTIEDPWLSIPDMIKDKITRKYLKIE